MISIEEFKNIEIRIGKIVAVEKIPEADRLLRLDVDFGNEVRQIVSGIATYFPDPLVLVGKLCPFVTNLEPRVIRGYTSNGMIMAVGNDDGSVFSLLEPSNTVPEGSRIK